MERQIDALCIAVNDNTATLLRDVHAGEDIAVGLPADGARVRLQVREDIAFGHKSAICAIAAGDEVLKYGEVIGRATCDIAPGEHVHVDNVESLRGRGDDQRMIAEGGGLTAAVDHEELFLRPCAFDASQATFMGYPRVDGSAGTRNLVGVISCVACANDVVNRLDGIEGVALFTHQQGCSQTMPDIKSIAQVLINLALNPNLGAVLLVSLGCESVPSDEVLKAVQAAGKPARMIVIQEAGGLTASVACAREIVSEMKKQIETERVAVPINRLRVGLKCGSSDTTQGFSANIVVGALTDVLVAARAGVVIGETTEFMGAEHIAARNSRNAEVRGRIVELVNRMEKRALAVGVDMRGGQPTRGNIAGGLTTIEEKSLGALAKAGSAVYQDVVDYGVRTSLPGLVMMDAPGREPEMLTGLAAAGCNLIVFSTGRGAPQGFPFVPVVKVTGNARTFERMSEHMDLCVAGLTQGTESVESAAGRLFEAVIRTASGEPTKAERCNYNNSMNIYVTGPVI